MTALLLEHAQPHTARSRLAAAIVAASPLREPDGEPWLGENVPGPLRHGTFQIEPGNGTHESAGAPGSSRVVKQLMLVTVRHDYDPGAHDAAYDHASTEFDAMVDAILSRPEAFAELQPEPGATTCKRVGHEIVQTLTLTVTFSRRIPE